MPTNQKPEISQSPLSADLSWLSGGGEMGALIRSMDWSRTPLGPVESWPQSLRTSVSLCLSSTFPILVAWGPEDIQIYNDAYRPICGAKHPESMGQGFKTCWATALPVVGDKFDRAHQGEGTYIHDQRMFLDRHGYLEEAFMTFSFSPIRAESGEVGGIFHPITETTDKVLGARRTQSLRDLSVHLGKAKTVGEMCRVLTAQHPHLELDLPFILFYQATAEGTAHLCGSAGLAAGSRLAPLSIELAGDSPWPFAEVARIHAAEEVNGLEAIFGPFECGPYPEAPTTALVLPVSVAGAEHPFGYLVAGVSPRRALDVEYRSFFELLMNTVNTAIGNITAYEQEQKRIEALAEIDRAKTVFFSNVSHEFRTPLTLILGPLDDALADREEPLGPHQRARLEVTQRNSLRLLKLVNSMLDFSRIEAGRTQARFKPTRLDRLTADLASVFRSTIEKAGLDFNVAVADLHEPVYVDHDMWEKIVFNLLSNAFKFTLQGAIDVRLARHGAFARLTVRDTGTGIPQAELPRLFERFHRIEGAQGRSYEGSGIGLALIQELAKLHGGGITVDSLLGQGSVFQVDIPFGKEHLPPECVIEEAAAPDGAGITGTAFVEEALRWLPEEALETRAPSGVAQPVRGRVIVADDNSDMRAYVKTLLERELTVDAYADGEEAFAAILRDPPDLVLSDVMMPRLDGFGLLQKLRAHEVVSNVPLILLSARAGEEARIEGLQAGANDYLVKPFAANELLARVRKQISLNHERRNTQRVLEEREAYFRSLVDTAPAMLWLTDAQSSCTYLSKHWYEYTGRPGEDLGLRWLEAVHPEDRQRAGEIFMAAHARHEVFNIDYRLMRHDGEFRWAIDSGVPRFDADGGFLGYIGVVIDVHERKRAEQELQLLATELSAADRHKNEFLATLAHELRNPLALITNGIEIMRVTGAEGAVSARVRDMMERQVMHIVRLVDDLLDISRISSGKLELKMERVELHRILSSAIETSLPLIEAARHKLDVRVPEQSLTLTVDPTRLAQILSNLLTNAAKYTPEGGLIVLSARVEKQTVEISVADNGIGISEEEQAGVFNMFSQVSRNTDRAQGGMGIGLSLVRSLVEMHHGSITVSSRGAGKGTTFTVVLPF